MHATWVEEADDNPTASTYSYPGSDIAARSIATQSATMSGTTGELLFAAMSSREPCARRSKLQDVTVFKIMDGHFAWLYEEDIAQYSKPAAQPELHEWLSGIR